MAKVSNNDATTSARLMPLADSIHFTAISTRFKYKLVLKKRRTFIYKLRFKMNAKWSAKEKKERVWREWEEKNTIFCFGLIKKCELFNAPIKMGINCVTNVSITQSAEQIVPQRRCCQREADRPNQKERESGEEWEYRERERCSSRARFESLCTWKTKYIYRTQAASLSCSLSVSHSLPLPLYLPLTLTAHLLV